MAKDRESAPIVLKQRSIEVNSQRGGKQRSSSGQRAVKERSSSGQTTVKQRSHSGQAAVKENEWSNSGQRVADPSDRSLGDAREGGSRQGTRMAAPDDRF